MNDSNAPDSTVLDIPGRYQSSQIEPSLSRLDPVSDSDSEDELAGPANISFKRAYQAKLEEPKMFKEAILSPFKDQWLAAITKEINSLIKMKT